MGMRTRSVRTRPGQVLAGRARRNDPGRRGRDYSVRTDELPQPSTQGLADRLVHVGCALSLQPQDLNGGAEIHRQLRRPLDVGPALEGQVAASKSDILETRTDQASARRVGFGHR